LSERALTLERVTKVYPVYRTPVDYFRRHEPGSDRAVLALDDVSFTVARGEVVGLIGRNGAGKSTLLRVAAGIAPPSRGSIRAEGPVYPLLELDSGLNLHISGRRNIVRRLELLGVLREAAHGAVNDIAEFAGVQDAIDDPVRNYSSGMKIRLAFSIATSIRPDIFLLDEVLAVGDEFFAERSFERIREITAGGRATIVASHDWNQTFRLCTRLVWLEKGRIRADGPPHEILYRYLSDLNAFELTREVEIERLELLGGDRRIRRELNSGDELRVRIHYRAKQPRSFTVVCGVMHRYTGESVLSAWSGDDAFVVPAHSGKGVVEVRYPELPLAGGEYEVVVQFAAPEEGPWPARHFDIWDPLRGEDGRLRVTGRGEGGCILALPATWSTEPVPA
jgi:ABC-type polysaccharide/polyol phosphate transport system ATPase subunit